MRRFVRVERAGLPCCKVNEVFVFSELAQNYDLNVLAAYVSQCFLQVCGWVAVDTCG